MRKTILFMLISLDGFFEGEDQSIDWHNVDAEFNEFAIAQLDTAGLLMFGRVTYEVMVAWWPTPAALESDPIVAGKMNQIPKVVFSKKLERAEWQNTRLVKENYVEEIAKLKNQPGKDIFIFGSSNLAVSLIEHDLIDVFAIMVNPVLLGQGTTLFKGLSKRYPLKLVDTRVFRSGNVLLYYEKLPS